MAILKYVNVRFGLDSNELAGYVVLARGGTYGARVFLRN